MTQHVRVTTADRVTTIRLDRPDKKNAITIEMYDALCAALEAAAADPAVRAVVSGGTRDCFTAGNDLGDFARAAQGGDTSSGRRFLHTLAGFDKPLIGAVAGVAIGIGTTMLLHCDLVYAAPTARFRTPFVDLALVPEAGSSLLLPALVGARRAAQLLLLGEQLDAQAALAWGLITAVVDDPDAAAAAAAGKLAGLPPG
ncbi:MAG TPA: enoyl-CoA hydratase-related protein, partial [Kofleriaceae bacterium]